MCTSLCQSWTFKLDVSWCTAYCDGSLAGLDSEPACGGSLSYVESACWHSVWASTSVNSHGLAQHWVVTLEDQRGQGRALLLIRSVRQTDPKKGLALAVHVFDPNANTTALQGKDTCKEMSNGEKTGSNMKIGACFAGGLHWHGTFGIAMKFNSHVVELFDSSRYVFSPPLALDGSSAARTDNCCLMPLSSSVGTGSDCPPWVLHTVLQHQPNRIMVAMVTCLLLMYQLMLCYNVQHELCSHVKLFPEVIIDILRNQVDIDSVSPLLQHPCVDPNESLCLCNHIHL